MSNYRLNAYCDKYNINILYLDKCKEFALYLAAIIKDKYLGDEFNDDFINHKHFEFWWERCVGEFQKLTNINFDNTSASKRYLKNLIRNVFYDSKLSIDVRYTMVISTINSLFNFSEYSESDLDLIFSLNNIFKQQCLK